MKKILIILCGSILLLSFGIYSAENYPVPAKNNKLLFYIQRNHNKNTIVYDANFDKNGVLDENNPVHVYWIRYEEQGQKMELRTIEKWYAYGVNNEKVGNRKGYFRLKLVANEGHKFWLKQEAPFKAGVYTTIDNKMSLLDHMYIFADESGIWPKVMYVELFGQDTITLQSTYEKIIY